MNTAIINDYARNNVDTLIYDINQKLLGCLIGFNLSGSIPRFVILAVSSEPSMTYTPVTFDHAQRIFGSLTIFYNQLDLKTKVYVPDISNCYFINGNRVIDHIK